MSYTPRLPMLAHQAAEHAHSRELEVRALWWMMGCVDGETEFLSRSGWVPIRRWEGQQVAQWDRATGAAEFVDPQGFQVQSCTRAFHISGARGTDQVVSPEHRVPVLARRGIDRGRVLLAEELVATLRRSTSNIRLPSSFTMPLPRGGVGLSPQALRLQVAVMADGHFPKKSRTNRCVVRLKKARKIERLRTLLALSGTEYRERPEPATGFTIFCFDAPVRQRRFAPWWRVVNEQDRATILDEVVHWDSHIKAVGKGWSFCSAYEDDVDFIQFLAASVGFVTSKAHSRGYWYLSVRGTRTNGYVVTRHNVKVVNPGHVYCFTLPSGYWIARRNGRIFPTGNCGKTAPVIHTAAHLFLAKKIDLLVVVLPNGALGNWSLREIPKHLGDPVAAQTRCLVWASKRAKTKTFQAECEAAVQHRGLLVVEISYDAIVRAGGDFIVALLHKRQGMVVLDECTKIKTPSSERTRAAMRLGKLAKYRRVLTGTPVDDNPFDCYMPLKFLHPLAWAPLGISTYSSFKAFFGVWATGYRSNNGRRQEFPLLTTYRNLGDLRKRLEAAGSRLRKSEVLDLPPKVYVVREFDLSPTQTRVYRQLRDDGLTVVNGGLLSITHALALLTQLQQVTGGYTSSEDMGRQKLGDERPRVDLLMELVDEAGAQSMIVWARFRAEIDEIEARLRADKVTFVRYDGSTSAADRTAAVDDFQAGKIKVFLANPAAAAEALTLHKATVVVYYSNNFKLGERAQSEDRAHRIGQTCSVLYVDIVGVLSNGEGTVDGKIQQVLLEKKDVAGLITGDIPGVAVVDDRTSWEATTQQHKRRKRLLAMLR